MGRSRSSREFLKNGGMMSRRKRSDCYAEGEEVENWMQDVHPKKGALRRQLHIAEGHKIPTKRLEEATHAKSPLLRKRANLALRYRGL